MHLRLPNIVFVIALNMSIAACPNDQEFDDNHGIEEHQSVSEIMDVLTEDNAPRSEAYLDVLDRLFELGIYGFDNGDLNNCNSDSLESFYLKRQLPNELRKQVEEKFLSEDGTSIFTYVLSIVDKSEEEINNDLHGNNIIKSSWYESEYENNLIMHLIWLAGEKGNVDALNEIGAAQIYCYQDVEQDIENAILALEKAAAQGDSLASMTLGKIYYSGLGGYLDKERGKKFRNVALENTIKELQQIKDIPDGN